MKIEIKDITKKIKGEVVLDHINLELKGGKIYGFQGKNGSGKTMLMRCVSGLVRPDEGMIKINQDILYRDISFPKSIGILIENPSFLERYNGLDNLKMLADLNTTCSKEDIERLLDKVGLSDVKKKKYAMYSLGMKQRLGIAAAIMGEPELIILDEPINAIDEDSIEEIRTLITDLKDDNRIIIVACHDRNELELLADEIIQLKRGKVVNTRDSSNE